uniref:histidine kinase n=1 Tax=Niallia circulans TaxID=1397 RepID=A0A110BIQ1_NIACI|nr:Nitrate/nitrite sensor protein NarX [Niallia circulans]
MLLLLRYALILFPAVSTAYMLPLEQSGQLAFYTLVLLAIAEISRSWLPRRAQNLAAAAEMLFVTWLSLQMEGMMFACHYSTLTAYMLKERSGLRWFLLALQVVLLNGSLTAHPDMELKLTANLLLATGALLLYGWAETGDRKRELEQVYDELRSKAYELDATRRRLVEYAGKVEQLAQTEERTRISHEIHDDLGHKLIRLKMMLEAIIRISPGQPEKGMEMTRSVRDQLTEAMDTLRRMVRRMKPPAEEGQSFSLKRLIEDFAADPQLQIRCEIAGMPRPLYPSLEIVLYRNAQEAVTNALRHGQATEVLIELSFEESNVSMTVSNNGTLPDSAAVGRGLGLSGMEERTRLVGGELRIQTGGRFAVTTLVPTPGAQ